MEAKTGVLLTNVGSPDALTLSSVRHFLKKFLSDKRVVQLPRIIWWPILHGLILRTRPKQSLAYYQKIWTKEGSPLSFISRQLATVLENESGIPVQIGMHYGDPSISDALSTLQKQQVNKIVILPLFPQYSATTTAATFDQVGKWQLELESNLLGSDPAPMGSDLNRFDPSTPKLTYINHYHDHEEYILTIRDSIQKHTFQYLLFSYHGIPQRYIKRDDPYAEQCHTTSQLLANKLGLSPSEWSISFQSRLGKTQWLKPYTDKLLASLPARGIKHLHVVCPGFPIDCLETLEEIAIRGKEQFIKAGGESFHYIPALNASDEHVRLLKKMIELHMYTQGG